jgi:hypothetical protein
MEYSYKFNQVLNKGLSFLRLEAVGGEIFKLVIMSFRPYLGWDNCVVGGI